MNSNAGGRGQPINTWQMMCDVSICTGSIFCDPLYIDAGMISTRIAFLPLEPPPPREMSSPQVSVALIPWDPHTTRTLIVGTQEDSSRQGKWALILNAISNPSPGRTLDRVYTSLGRVLETQANRAAYGFGLGPNVVAQKIKSNFGMGDQRTRQLKLLPNSMPPKLAKQCSKLMKYTLPCVSPNCSPGRI
jgi:hypothetical protein